MTVKIVFVQAEAEDMAPVGEMLNNAAKFIPDCPYFFLVMPKGYAAMTRDEVEEMLMRLPPDKPNQQDSPG